MIRNGQPFACIFAVFVWWLFQLGSLTPIQGARGADDSCVVASVYSASCTHRLQKYRLVPATTYLRVKRKPVDGWKATIRSANVGRDGFHPYICEETEEGREWEASHIWAGCPYPKQDIKCRKPLDLVRRDCACDLRCSVSQEVRLQPRSNAARVTQHSILGVSRADSSKEW